MQQGLLIIKNFFLLPILGKCMIKGCVAISGTFNLN